MKRAWNIVTHACAALAIAYALHKLQDRIGSDFLERLAQKDLVSLLLVLFSINTTTLGLMLSKIRDLLDRSGDPNGFRKTRAGMLASIYEQIGLVGVAVLLLIVQDSTEAKQNVELEWSLAVGCTATLVYAVMILEDTARAAFKLLSVGTSEAPKD